jgi:hypothetical protein
MSSENECLCCIDLNNKLKCALDEVSSLNLIIQLIRNGLMYDCVRASSDTNPSIDKQEDHEESTHKNWIEVNPKLRSNLYNFLNPILFAICTSTFSKLCVTYTLTCRRELSSAPL